MDEKQGKAITAQREPLNRISFRLYPTDKQKLLSAFPGDLAFAYTHLVTRIIAGEISLSYLAEYPERTKRNEKKVQVQPLIGYKLKNAFETYCYERGVTPSVIAIGLASALIDQKITLNLVVDEEAKNGQ